MIQGTLRDVSLRKLGSTVAEDAAAGDLTLTVYDVFDFDEEGGTLQLTLNGDDTDPILTYTGIIEDTGVFFIDEDGDEESYSKIILDPTTPVPVNLVGVGESIEVSAHVWPPGEEKIGEVYIESEVEFDFPDELGDDPDSVENEEPSTISARLSHSVSALLPEGIRTEESGYETVLIVEEDAEWVITEVLGTPASIDGSYIDPDSTIPPEALTDGEPPEAAPVIEVHPFAVGSLEVTWSLIDNPDPTQYRIYASIAPDVVTTGDDNFIGTSAGTSFIFNTVGGLPVSTENPTYVRVRAYDADGVGPDSNESFNTARGVTLIDFDDEVNDFLDDLSEEINDVRTSANGKNKVHYTTTAPVVSPDDVKGDVWYVMNSTNTEVLAMFVHNGTTWTYAPLSHLAISSMDAAKITVGVLDANRIGAKTISAEKMLLADTTNLVEDADMSREASIYLDPAKHTWDLNPSSNWSFVSGVTLPWTNSTGRVAQLTASSAGVWTWIRPNVYTPTKAGDIWYASFYVRKTNAATSGEVNLYMDWSGGLNGIISKKLNDMEVGEWTKLEGNFTIAGGDTSTLTSKVRPLFWTTDTPVGTVIEVAGFTMRRAASAELIVDGSIKARHIYGDTIEADEITGKLLYVGEIEAKQIRGDSIFAKFAQSDEYVTGDTDPLVRINRDGIEGTSGPNQVRFRIPTDPDEDATFIGNITATSATIENMLSLRGMSNVVIPESKLELQSALSGPTNKPTIVSTYPSAPLSPFPSGYSPYGYGTQYKKFGDTWYGTASRDSDNALCLFSFTENATTGELSAPVLVRVMGVYAERVTVGSSTVSYEVVDWLIRNSKLYIGYNRVTITYYSPPPGVRTPEPLSVAVRNKYIDRFPLTSGAKEATYQLTGMDENHDLAAITEESSTYITVVTADARQEDEWILTRYIVPETGSSASLTRHSTLTFTANPLRYRPVTIQAVPTTSLNPAGSGNRYAILDQLGRIYVFSGATNIPGEGVTGLPLTSDIQKNIWFDSVTNRWYGFNEYTVYKFNNQNSWDGGSRTAWAGYSWLDLSTADGTDQHESKLSPLGSTVLKKFSQVSVSAGAALPSANTITPANSVTHIRIYLGTTTTTTKPSISTLRRSGTDLGAGQLNKLYTFPLDTTGGAPEPALPARFPRSSPAEIASQVIDDKGPLNLMKGDGSGRMGPYIWDKDGRTSTPAIAVYKTSGQTLTSGGGTTLVTMDTLRVPAQGGMILESGTVTVPMTGWYRVSGCVTFSSSTSSARRMVFVTTGASPGTINNTWMSQTLASPQTDASFTTLMVSASVFVNAGQSIGMAGNVAVNWGIDVSQAYMNNMQVVWEG